MEVDQPYTTKTSNQHHQTSTNMGPPREEEKRKTQKLRYVETELKMGYTWNEITMTAQSRTQQRAFVDGPSSQRANRPKYVGKMTGIIYYYLQTKQAEKYDLILTLTF